MILKKIPRIKWMAVLVLVLVLVLVIIAVFSLKKKEVEIYAINMMYACGECSVYKIVESEYGQLRYKSDFFYSHGNDKLFIYNVNKLRGVVSQNSKSLIGTEFYVTFHDSKKRNEFESVSGAVKYPACYVFYFKGTLSNKLTWFYEKYNLLAVRGYKLIPIKECIDENSERQSK